MDGEYTYPESKLITWNFHIYPSDGDIDDIIDAIYQEAGKGRRVLLATMRDGTTQRQQWVKLVSASTNPDSKVYIDDNTQGDGYEVMQCQFEMAYPYWVDTSESPLLLDNGLVLDNGLSLDAGNYDTLTHQLGATTTTKTITNSGNVDIKDFTISITATAENVGFVYGITIKNTTTGEQIKWDDGSYFKTGSLMTINNLERTIYYDGVNAYPDVTLPNTQVGFLTLVRGDNVFSITYDISDFTYFSIASKMTYRWDWASHYIR